MRLCGKTQRKNTSKVRGVQPSGALQALQIMQVVYQKMQSTSQHTVQKKARCCFATHWNVYKKFWAKNNKLSARINYNGEDFFFGGGNLQHVECSQHRDLSRDSSAQFVVG